MGPILRSLIWKEWREQRWKLGFGCALLAGVTAIGLRARIVEDLAVHLIVFCLGGVLLPLFVAMGLAAAERAEGSLAVLLSMPASPRLVFTIKMAMGALVTAAPFAAACLTGLWIAGEREAAAGEVLRYYLAGVLMGLLVLVWTACLGIGQPSEARAGLTGLACCGGFALAIAVVSGFGLGPPLWHPLVWAAAAGTDRQLTGIGQLAA